MAPAAAMGPRRGAPPHGRRRWRRIGVVAALAGLVAGVVGLGALLMVGGAGCEAEEVRRAPDGAWRIERVDCGATVSESWRVMLSGADGRERLALDTYRYPEALEAALAPGLLRVRLAEPGPWRDVPIDAALRPVAPLRLMEGAPRR